MQAAADVLKFGVAPDVISSYDHLEFSGVVPRTFVGALVRMASGS